MRRKRDSFNRISIILRISLVAVLICAGISFLHVYDVKKFYLNYTTDNFIDLNNTGIIDLNEEINGLKEVSLNSARLLERNTDPGKIVDMIREIEKYNSKYNVSYITPDSKCYDAFGLSVEPAVYSDLKDIPISLFNEDNYACVHSGKYLPTYNQKKNHLVGIVRIYSDEGYSYLFISQNIDDVLLGSAFKQINQKGFLAVVDEDGDIISSSASYLKMFKDESNIVDGLTDYVSSDNKNNKRALLNLKRNLLGSKDDNDTLVNKDGRRSHVYYGKLNNYSKIYYVSFYEGSAVEQSINPVVFRSFLVCFLMMLFMVFLVVYTWYTLNDSNDFILRLAFIDEVTGRYNYNYFKRNACSIVERNNQFPFILLRFDILNFRYINEAYGHEKADLILKATVDEFIKNFDSTKEICARINSDQFVALCINDIEFDEKYVKYVKGISDAAVAANVKFPIRLKVGIYQIKKEDKDINLMIDRANVARKSVDLSKNNFMQSYSEEIIRSISQINEIESEMNKALSKGEFKVFIQPKWDINEDCVVGGEALVRWIKSDGSVVYPSDFIPIFESNGFIEKIDFFMLEQVCIRMREISQLGNYRIYPISINQSRILINNPDYVEIVRKILNRYDTDVSKIQLEITESVFFEEKEKMKDVIFELKKIGLNLAMDDFGSGFSSLNILKEIPFDILKIDKDFFDETFTSQTSKVILQKIMEMAEGIGIDVICEGVEETEQVEILRGFGAKTVQGYLYGKPMPCDEFIEKYCKM